MFVGFADHDNWLRMRNKIENNCVACGLEVPIDKEYGGDSESPIYWNRKRAIMHETCYDNQKKLTRDIRDEILETLITDPPKAKEKWANAMARYIPRSKFHRHLLGLMETADYENASMLIESALTADSENGDEDPVLHVQLAIAQSPESSKKKSFAGAEKHLDTALNIFEYRKESYGTFGTYDYEMLEILGILAQAVGHVFDNERAKRLAEIVLSIDPDNINALLTKADASADKDACEIYNNALSQRRGGPHRRFLIVRKKFLMLCKNETESRDKALENVKKFMSPSDPELLLWFFENFYMPCSSSDQAAAIKGIKENGKITIKTATPNVLEELDKKQADLARFDSQRQPLSEKAEINWDDLPNRYILSIAQQRHFQLEEAVKCLDSYLRMYGPATFDEIIGIERGTATTRWQESLVYCFWFIDMHIQLFAMQDHEKAVKFFKTAVSAYGQSRDERFFGNKTLMMIDEGFVARKDEAGREKFLRYVLEQDENNQFALEKLGEEARASSEKPVIAAGSTATEYPSIPDEGPNVEWKKGWHLDDKEKEEIKNCDSEFIKKLEDEDVKTDSRQKILARLSPGVRSSQAPAWVQDCVWLDIVKTVNAFLNSDGGTLYFGVAEKDGKPDVVGISNDVTEAGGAKDDLRRSIRQRIEAFFNDRPNNLFEAGEGFCSFEFAEQKDGKEILLLKVKKIPEYMWPVWVLQKNHSELKEKVYDAKGEAVAMQRIDESDKERKFNSLEFDEWKRLRWGKASRYEGDV